jgi:hypothetical protein
MTPAPSISNKICGKKMKSPTKGFSCQEEPRLSQNGKSGQMILILACFRKNDNVWGKIQENL